MESGPEPDGGQQAFMGKVTKLFIEINPFRIVDETVRTETDYGDQGE